MADFQMLVYVGTDVLYVFGVWVKQTHVVLKITG